MKKRCKNMENIKKNDKNMKNLKKTWKEPCKNMENMKQTWKNMKKQCSSKHYNPAKTLITIKTQGK